MPLLRYSENTVTAFASEGRWRTSDALLPVGSASTVEALGRLGQNKDHLGESAERRASKIKGGAAGLQQWHEGVIDGWSFRGDGDQTPLPQHIEHRHTPERRTLGVSEIVGDESRLRRRQRETLARENYKVPGTMITAPIPVFE